MTNDATDPSDLPNGSGNGDTSPDAEDTTSGGAPDQPWSAPKPASDNEAESSEDGTSD